MKAIRFAVAGATLIICLPLAHAEDAVPSHPALQDKFYFGAGAFLPKTSVTYQPFRHVGFGLAYRSLFIILKATGPDFSAQFNQTFQGPLLYMNASF